MPTSLDKTCEEQFGVDFTSQLRLLLPYFWEFSIQDGSRKESFMNFAEVLFKSLDQSNSNLVELCEFIRDRLAYTGQVLSLVTLLNDKFDPVLRRITITCLNANFVEGIDIFLNGEIDPSPIMLFTNGENIFAPITLFTNAEAADPTSLEGISFVVNVPNDVPTSDAVIRALLDLYVIAPQEYLIERF